MPRRSHAHGVPSSRGSAGYIRHVSEPTAPPTSQRNSAAIGSVVCGVGAFVGGLLILFALFFPLAVTAIVLGIKGVLDARELGRGRAMAIIGIVLGVLALILVPIAAVMFMSG